MMVQQLNPLLLLLGRSNPAPTKAEQGRFFRARVTMPTKG